MIEADDDDGEIARPGDCGGRIEDRDAEDLGVLACGVNRAEPADVETFGKQVARHGRAHLAEAEHSNFAHCNHRHLSTSIARRGGST